MRITEPYNETDKDKNYIREYLYILMKNNNNVTDILKKIYPSVTATNSLIKHDVDIMINKYLSEYKDYRPYTSKYNMISDIKDRLLQRYTTALYETLRTDLNRNIVI